MGKAFLWIVFLVVSISALVYFVGYPYYLNYVNDIQGNNTSIELPDASEQISDITSEGWAKVESFTYTPRDIPSVEKDFYSIGYPPFLYASDEVGAIDKTKESSHHESGMVVTLKMNENYYVSGGEIDFTVPQNRFNSTAMENNVGPLIDFIRIITNKEVSETDKTALLREYALVFNETDSNLQHSVKINDLTFLLSLDKFYLSIILGF